MPIHQKVKATMTETALDYSYYFWQQGTIRLRALSIEDAEQQFAHTLDSISREEFNIGIELPSTIELQKVYLEKYSGCKQVNDTILFAIETLEHAYIGIAAMHSIDERHGKFSFSVFVDRQHRKRGYAEAAVRLILKYGFLERRMHKCKSACASYNPASIQLHRKLGFIQEGVLRKEWFWNGKHHDELLFGQTLEEYYAANHINN